MGSEMCIRDRNNRLTSWYLPQREQAGGQLKRGCIEHILTLRLWINYCKCKQKKLFVAFIDFSKAYDCVPRGKLFSVLLTLGCGTVMLCALMSIYSLTSCILGSAVITFTIGVRQGSPTSVFLFIIYVDILIKMIKSRCPPDGFLSWLHILMLMDDTVIFATSRKELTKKMEILREYCREYGMKINESKTKFLVINGLANDRKDINLEDFKVRHCTSYLYLGVIFTENGSGSSSLKAHVAEKKQHLNRLNIFLSRNYDAPFFIKRKVFDAAFSSGILYGCESWLDIPLKPIESMYMTAVRRLLDVRKSTPILTCLVEAGLPSLDALVKQRQSRFLRKIFNCRTGLSTTDPLMFTLDFMRTNCEPIYRTINNIMRREDYISDNLEEHRRLLRNAPIERTKFCLYTQMNPDLSINPLYQIKTNQPYIEDSLRISFTRLRLSSHNLRSEIGRWNRVFPNQCLCPHCNGRFIQNEEHLLNCCSTLTIRRKYNVGNDILELFKNPN